MVVLEAGLDMLRTLLVMLEYVLMVSSISNFHQELHQATVSVVQLRDAMSNIVEENTFKEPEEKTLDFIEQAKADWELKEVPPTFDPIATSSAIFQNYYPMFCNQLDKLSRKQMVRLMKASYGIPLETDIKPNLKDPEEMKSFFLGEKLLQSKMVLMHAFFIERQKENNKYFK